MKILCVVVLEGKKQSLQLVEILVASHGFHLYSLIEVGLVTGEP